jgi:hypothetical protein
MAASIITTAAFLSDFITTKYRVSRNKEFTCDGFTKHSGNLQIHCLKHG